jgi:hypothetical protein
VEQAFFKTLAINDKPIGPGREFLSRSSTSSGMDDEHSPRMQE